MESSCHDRLAFKPNQKLNELLHLTQHDLDIINNNNSALNTVNNSVTNSTHVSAHNNLHSNKQLRVRYRIGGMHGTLILDFMPTHTIPAPFLLILPRTRYLRIFSATYGFPKGEFAESVASLCCCYLVHKNEQKLIVRNVC